MQAAWNYLKSNPTLIPATLGVIFAFLAFVFSLISFWMTRTSTLYSDMDGRYMDLLKLAINNPHFRDADLTVDYTQWKKDRAEYEIYAFSAWNIVETIFDRRKRFGFNVKLYETWKPVIKEENRLHRAWLNVPENQPKFKPEFVSFILDNHNDFPCPVCKKTKDSLCDRCKERSTNSEMHGTTSAGQIERS